DYLIQALVGTMSLTGEPDGPPAKYGVSVVDHVGGLFAAIGVLAALRGAERTGEGRHVDLSLFDTHLSLLSYIAADHLTRGAPPPVGAPVRGAVAALRHRRRPRRDHAAGRSHVAAPVRGARPRRARRRPGAGVVARPAGAARARDRGGGRRRRRPADRRRARA